MPAVAALVLVAAHLPTLAAETRAIVYRHAGSDLSATPTTWRSCKAATAPGDFVVIDDAYLAMLTGRLTPPFLADLSWNRILARALTADQAIAETRRFDSKILILQDDHLGQVQRYLAWADHEYVLVKSYVQRRPARFRRVYASPSVDLAAVRDALRATLASPTDVRIGPAALLGYDLERREIKPGSRVDLTLMFEALQDRPPEHALITRLRDRSGETAWESEWKVGDGGQELHTWQQGRWQAQTLRLLIDDVPEGSYTLTIALQRPNGNAGAGRGAVRRAGLGERRRGRSRRGAGGPMSDAVLRESPQTDATSLVASPPSPRPSRAWRTSRLGVAAASVGIAVVAVALRAYELRDVPRLTDETDEVMRGLAIARGELLPLTNVDAYIGPLWNYLLALGFLVVGPTSLLPRVLTLLAAVATVAAAGWLGREAALRLGRPDRANVLGLGAALLLATSSFHAVVSCADRLVARPDAAGDDDSGGAPAALGADAQLPDDGAGRARVRAWRYTPTRRRWRSRRAWASGRCSTGGRR